MIRAVITTECAPGQGHPSAPPNNCGIVGIMIKCTLRINDDEMFNSLAFVMELNTEAYCSPIYSMLQQSSSVFKSRQRMIHRCKQQ